MDGCDNILVLFEFSLTYHTFKSNNDCVGSVLGDKQGYFLDFLVILLLHSPL